MTVFQQYSPYRCCVFPRRRLEGSFCHCEAMATALAQSMACPKVVVMQAGASLSESRCTNVSLFRVEMLNILCSFLLNYLIDSFHLVTKNLLSTVITLCIDYTRKALPKVISQEMDLFLTQHDTTCSSRSRRVNQ